MTTTITTDSSFTFKGIKMPTLKYRFSAHFMLPNNQSLPSLSSEVEYIKYDLKSKTGETFIRIPVNGHEEMSDIDSICQNGGNIMVSTHDGSSKTGFNIYLTGVEILECPISHEYAVSELLGAKISFKYESIQFFIPKSDIVPENKD